MAHIPLAEGLPGIRGLFAFRPETANPLCELAEVLLHTPGTLSMADRELIATYVSSRNDCYYCQTSHGALGEELAAHYALAAPSDVFSEPAAGRKGPPNPDLIPANNPVLRPPVAGKIVSGRRRIAQAISGITSSVRSRNHGIGS
jgi:AhpD family alkylhydroperoxidase